MNLQKHPFALAALALVASAPFAAHAAPSVSWRAPTSGATITQSISGTAACEVGGSGIRRVEFSIRPYSGGTWTPLNIDQDSPWRCNLDVSKFAPGKYTLRALAFDRDSGGTYTKASQTITIGSGSTTTPPPTETPTTGAPTVTITAPASGATVKGTQVACAATATDSDGIKSVTFSINGTWIKTDTTLPHSCIFDSTKLKDGTNTLRAVATDNKLVTTTQEVSFTVQNGTTTPTNTPPTVSLTAPASGATLSGSAAAYAADASDAGGSVTKVDFFLVPAGGTPGTPFASRTATPYSGTVNTTTVANGTYTLMAVATDNGGLSATTQKSVTISNTTTSEPPKDEQPPQSPGTGTTLSANGAKAVPTFESLGMYWKPTGSTPGAAGCNMRYRKFSESAWREALPMWFDSRDGECRGSIVHLEPGTDYAVEMGTGGSWNAGVNTKTWSENFPIAKTIQVQSGTGAQGTLTITEGGTPQGYVLYTGPATLDGANIADYSVNIKASYVIVRGLTLKGAKVDGITISPAVTNVVIEDNDISGWGRPSGLVVNDVVQGKDRDSGIRSNCVNTPGSMQRAIIQRNKIHDPRYGSNSWDGKKHPLGPVGIEISHCGGNNVIRYNEITSKDGHYFKDGMGGQENFSKLGFSSADNDIYGNIVTHAWDDGIEAEGGGRNTRIWGNYIDKTAVGIATTGVAVGPMYIFRNVQNRSQHYIYISSLDADDRMTFSKTGSPSGWGDGRRYIFHNTLLQAKQDGLVNGLGAGEGISGLSNAPLTNTVSRNNVLHVWKAGALSVFSAGGTGNDLDYDLVSGNVNAGTGAEPNRIVGTPLYRSGHGWSSWAGGNYQLDPSSPGYNRGARIPNFNDAFTGSAPDVGAHEGDTPPMRLGVGGGSAASAAGGGSTSGGDTSLACAKSICLPTN